MTLRAFVTGGTGFVGRALVDKLLLENWRVKALVRSTSIVPQTWRDNVELVSGDIRDQSACEKGARGVDSIFHFAAAVHDVAGGDERRQQSTTLEGTRVVLEAAGTMNVAQFIFASSLAVYGESDVVRDELHQCCPTTEYGRTKLAAEHLVSSMQTSRLQWTILRPAMIYGVGAPGSLSLMVRLIRARMLPALPRHMGRRSFVHVADVVQAALLTVNATRASGATFNVTDFQPMSLREIQDEIRVCMGRIPHRYSIPTQAFVVAARLAKGFGRLGNTRSRSLSDWIERMLASAEFDSQKIERELGFRPTTSLRRELPSIVANFSTPKSTTTAPVRRLGRFATVGEDRE